eukprot:1289817-Pleurochrysis_carterae.AAC.1
MGTTGVIDYELTWLAGVHTTGKLLPSTHIAVIRLYWRHVYAAMTRLKFDKEPFSVNVVNTGIACTLYSRLLAYQHSLAIRFYKQRYSSKGNYILPASTAKRFSPFGSIRLVDGQVTMKAAVLS